MTIYSSTPGLSESLLGVGANPDLIDTAHYINKQVVKTATSNNNNPQRMILAIIISAVIFVTVVAIYSIIRNIITNYYTKKAITDPKAKLTPEVIETTLIYNKYGLVSSIVFAVVTIIIAIIAIYLSWSYFKN